MPIVSQTTGLLLLLLLDFVVMTFLAWDSQKHEDYFSSVYVFTYRLSRYDANRLTHCSNCKLRAVKRCNLCIQCIGIHIREKEIRHTCGL